MTELLRAVDLKKSYYLGKREVPVLRGVDLRIEEGEMIALLGASGAGKSTLLHLLGLLDAPTSGQVLYQGQSADELSLRAKAKLRHQVIGFVFQFYHLLPVLSALENVELPLLLLPLSAKQRREQALNALDIVGLADRVHHRPGQLSGGQQQRVGIARAIVTDPAIIVADEPTGDLDAKSAEAILELLVQLKSSLGKSIVMVTHDPRAAQRADRTLHLDKGRLVESGMLEHA